MGHIYPIWESQISSKITDLKSLKQSLLLRSRLQEEIELEYGNWGLDDAFTTILAAIKKGKKVALYADYDVDGTMSCVSWIWFFKEINFTNYTYHIPNRFTEGYGVNLAAIQKLVLEEKVEMIITMDCGITANKEAQWCKQEGVEFICTDHHKIDPERMPDCITLNPKAHPVAEYQDLCGCGITFVLLRKLGSHFECSLTLWQDLLAITGMATICDLVPLTSVNHKLARLGVKALMHSQRPVLKKLLQASRLGNSHKDCDEQDIGFKLGPKINAVGRLDHGQKIIKAFVDDDCDELVEYMHLCNEERKAIQEEIVAQASQLAQKQKDDPILFLGGDWHQGVIGIAASRLAQDFAKPVWLFCKQQDVFKGSARSISGFDVTDCMSTCKDLWLAFGGHTAAGGFSFHKNNEHKIHSSLLDFASKLKKQNPSLWIKKIHYHCKLESFLLDFPLLNMLDTLRPFGQDFCEAIFQIEGKIQNITFYKNKQTLKPAHTCLTLALKNTSKEYRVIFFQRICSNLKAGEAVKVLVTVNKNIWQGKRSISLIAFDYDHL